ncbi:hypothetical protein HYPSUDRAFT_638507 [Hypholoma sublateritium FD-334 SS-4]|uniref:Uncharacterized protein n=1 Tax=Hypholoma sublateritium (strain FD-334 SS-4) TaxID=945553 RepID=A0A0D2NVE8_HYPSF|nr:hypothetical protein HYPSUDRAFT_638507 [Hypholoma sublateritium FD-334 SS-4]
MDPTVPIDAIHDVPHPSCLLPSPLQAICFPSSLPFPRARSTPPAPYALQSMRLSPAAPHATPSVQSIFPHSARQPSFVYLIPAYSACSYSAQSRRPFRELRIPVGTRFRAAGPAVSAYRSAVLAGRARAQAHSYVPRLHPVILPYGAPRARRRHTEFLVLSFAVLSAIALIRHVRRAHLRVGPGTIRCPRENQCHRRQREHSSRTACARTCADSTYGRPRHCVRVIIDLFAMYAVSAPGAPETCPCSARSFLQYAQHHSFNINNVCRLWNIILLHAESTLACFNHRLGS